MLRAEIVIYKISKAVSFDKKINGLKRFLNPCIISPVAKKEVRRQSFESHENYISVWLYFDKNVKYLHLNL